MIPRKPIHKIGLIARRNISEKPQAAIFIKQLIKYLKEHEKEVFLDPHCAAIAKSKTHFKKDHLLKEMDMVITLGGDGTLLKTARCVSRKRVLILGINLGNLGFLTECTPEKTFACLDKIFANQYHIDRRSLLRITIYRDNKPGAKRHRTAKALPASGVAGPKANEVGNQKVETFLALNDAVINQGAFARLITIDLALNGRKVVQFKADGMIIATPTGSTAHSLSAGGPIVHPQIEGLIITPICPSSLSMRSIIIPENRQLTVSIETKRREDNDIIGLTIDGQDLFMLKYGDQIKFRRSKRYVYLLRLKNSYYKMLRSKLNWG